MMHNRTGNKSTEILDALIIRLVRFFNADWSGALLAVVVLAISIELVTDGKSFFHPGNLMTILNNSASLGIVAAGMTLVILTAGIDLSVGSVLGLTAALTGYVASYWGFFPWAAILFGLGLGLAVGLIHGTLVARFGMPAFIVTLAGLSIWRGTGHLSTGAQATPKLSRTFDYFGRYNPLSWLREGYREGSLPDLAIPLGRLVDSLWLEYLRTFQMSLIIFIVFYIVLAVIVKNTKLGRYTFAIGSNEQGARQAGIPVIFYKTLAYAICSMGAALGAVMFLGRAPYAKSDYGMMWELDAIAAVVIGGTSLFGGRGSIWGTFLGVILLKLINNGLTLAQLETFWQMVVTGLIILVAVSIDIVRQNASPKAVRQLLMTIAALMMFFAFVAPGSKVLGNMISMMEHRVALSLKIEKAKEGKSIAPNQQKRIMDDQESMNARESMKAHKWYAILFALLTITALCGVAYYQLKVVFVLCMIFMAGIVVAQTAGYSSVVPFLILGLMSVTACFCVEYLFNRAKKLSVIE